MPDCQKCGEKDIDTEHSCQLKQLTQAEFLALYPATPPAGIVLQTPAEFLAARYPATPKRTCEPGQHIWTTPCNPPQPWSKCECGELEWHETPPQPRTESRAGLRARMTVRIFKALMLIEESNYLKCAELLRETLAELDKDGEP